MTYVSSLERRKQHSVPEVHRTTNAGSNRDNSSQKYKFAVRSSKRRRRVQSEWVVQSSNRIDSLRSNSTRVHRKSPIDDPPCVDYQWSTCKHQPRIDLHEVQRSRRTIGHWQCFTWRTEEWPAIQLLRRSVDRRWTIKCKDQQIR